MFSLTAFPLYQINEGFLPPREIIGLNTAFTTTMTHPNQKKSTLSRFGQYKLLILVPFYVFSMALPAKAIGLHQCKSLFLPVNEQHTAFGLKPQLVSLLNKFSIGVTKQKLTALIEATAIVTQLKSLDLNDLAEVLSYEAPALTYSDIYKSQSLGARIKKFWASSELSNIEMAQTFPLEFWQQSLGHNGEPTTLILGRYVQMYSFFYKQQVSPEAILLISLAFKELPNSLDFTFDTQLSKASFVASTFKLIDQYIENYKEIRGSVPDGNTLFKHSEIFREAFKEVELRYQKKAIEEGYISHDQIKVFKNIMKKSHKNAILNIEHRDALFRLLQKLFSGKALIFFNRTRLENYLAELLDADIRPFNSQVYDFLYYLGMMIKNNGQIPLNAAKTRYLLEEHLATIGKSLRKEAKDIQNSQNELEIAPFEHAPAEPQLRMSPTNSSIKKVPQQKSKKRKASSTQKSDDNHLSSPEKQLEVERSNIAIISDLSSIEAESIYTLAPFERSLNGITSGSQQILVKAYLSKKLQKKHQNLEEWLKLFALGEARYKGQSGLKKLRIANRSNRDWWELKDRKSDWRVLVYREASGLWVFDNIVPHKEVDRYIMSMHH